MRPLLFLLLCLATPANARGQAASASPASTRIPYRVVPDSGSGAKLPRLIHTPTLQTRAVNRRLDAISAGMRCLQRMDGFGRKTEHWSTAWTSYAADDVLSVSIHFGGFCGGAHPINGENVSVTFDLRTGKPVEFRALFADWERDAEAIVRAMFPAQTAAADGLHRSATGEYDVDEEAFCVQFYVAEDLARQYFGYVFSDSGLVAEPSLAHAVVPCIEEAAVPYERLLPFAAPGGILERVARARASSGMR
jgi:hypothetical protein